MNKNKLTVQQAVKEFKNSFLPIEGYMADAHGYVQKVIVDYKSWKQFLRSNRKLQRKQK